MYLLSFRFSPAVNPTLRIHCKSTISDDKVEIELVFYSMEFTGINGTSYKWTVNLPASTGAIAFAITDNKGNEAYTDEVSLYILRFRAPDFNVDLTLLQVVIKKSDDVSCLSAASTGVASTSGAAPTTSTAVTNAPFSSGAE
jgi:hypothetical protein